MKKVLQVLALSSALVFSGTAASKMRHLEEEEVQALTFTLGFCSSYVDMYVGYGYAKTQEMSDFSYELNMAFITFAQMIDGFSNKDIRKIARVSSDRFYVFNKRKDRHDQHNMVLSYCTEYLGKVHKLQEGEG